MGLLSLARDGNLMIRVYPTFRSLYFGAMSFKSRLPAKPRHENAPRMHRIGLPASHQFFNKRTELTRLRFRRPDLSI